MMTEFVLDRAIEELNRGGVVAIPTETVYGLAARIDNPSAVKKIFAIKKRPFFDPLIVHVSSKKMAEGLTTDWSPLADFLAEHFWPGPLTLVLPKSPKVDPLITSGLETVALRMPKHTLALSLIDRLNMPLAAPSANRFGKTSPTCAEHVRQEFPGESLTILDGGACEVGLESTVLFIRRMGERYQLSILRTGAITRSDLEKTFAYQKFSVEFVEQVEKKYSPGHMKHHYMPAIPLVLVRNPHLSETQIRDQAQAQIGKLPDEVEGVKIEKPEKIQRLVELTLSARSFEAARELYARLREVSQGDLIYFRVQPQHHAEDWQAIMDRLTKAASLTLT